MKPLLVKIPEAAAALGVGRDEIYNLVAAGELQRVTTGKRGARIVVASLEAYVERLASAPAPQVVLRRVAS